jgi:acetylornithine deacetylase/succinyl-diaminopimelate desuccinylase-like protein
MMQTERSENGTTVACSHAGTGPEELAVDLARDGIRYDTSNPPGRERPLQEDLARRLTAAGLFVELVGPACERPNLVAALRADREAPRSRCSPMCAVDPASANPRIAALSART